MAYHSVTDSIATRTRQWHTHVGEAPVLHGSLTWVTSLSMEQHTFRISLLPAVMAAACPLFSVMSLQPLSRYNRIGRWRGSTPKAQCPFNHMQFALIGLGDAMSMLSVKKELDTIATRCIVPVQTVYHTYIPNDDTLQTQTRQVVQVVHSLG